MKNLLIILTIALGSTAFSQSTYVHLDQEASPKNFKTITDAMDYPSSLSAVGEEGTVIFRVLVDEKGNYKKHTVVSSSNVQFTASAEQQLPKLQFDPARHDNKNVTSWVFIPVHFRLADNYAIR